MNQERKLGGRGHETPNTEQRRVTKTVRFANPEVEVVVIAASQLKHKSDVDSQNIIRHPAKRQHPWAGPRTRAGLKELYRKVNKE